MPAQTPEDRQAAIRLEDDVRSIARLLWPQARHGGAELFAGKEHDGIFRTEEAIHAIEATVSRRMDKAESDADKVALQLLTARRTNPEWAIKGWIVTKYEPTADQRSAVEKVRSKRQVPITILSYKSFYNKLIDINEYTAVRSAMPFGSIEDPETGAGHDPGPYIPMDIMELTRAQKGFIQSSHLHSASDIAQLLHADGPDARVRFVILGDYGTGKSTTVRQVFRSIATDIDTGIVHRLPLALNLRDHHGQRDPVECIERHARRIAFSNPHHLVRAWRADRTILLLDGFDEMLPTTLTTVRQLRALRRDATELIREFLRESPARTPIVISGRQHFFDTVEELCDCLGCTAEFRYLSLNEFSPEQVRRFLSARGWNESVPDWLPRRPLLLGYLATRGVLEHCLTQETDTDGAAQGWNRLLSSVCARESRVPQSVNGNVIREILERIATRARATQEGLGPISTDKIRTAFSETAGYEPDERAMVLLQRLPGLVVTAGHSAGRSFVDTDYADALRAGDVFRFIENPYLNDHLEISQWISTLGRLGIEVVAQRIEESKLDFKLLHIALKRATQLRDGGALAAEIMQVHSWLGVSYDGDSATIESAAIEALSFTEESPDFSRLTFSNCVFGTVVLEGEVEDARLPAFTNCSINSLVGRVSSEDLPSHWTRSDVEHFSNELSTTASILGLSASPGVRVLLTVLKKLFLQPGKGRKESAFYRGLDEQDRQYVGEALAIASRFDFAARIGSTDIWKPDRSKGVRVRRLLAAPNRAKDPILEAADKL